MRHQRPASDTGHIFRSINVMSLWNSTSDRERLNEKLNATFIIWACIIKFNFALFELMLVFSDMRQL